MWRVASLRQHDGVPAFSHACPSAAAIRAVLDERIAQSTGDGVKVNCEFRVAEMLVEQRRKREVRLGAVEKRVARVVRMHAGGVAKTVDVRECVIDRAGPTACVGAWARVDCRGATGARYPWARPH